MLKATVGKMRSAWSALRRRWSGLDETPREGGLREEVFFWEQWLETRGLDWPHDFVRRCDPNAPLAENLTALIDCPAGSTVKILDVGAGPMTHLGKVWAGRKVDLVAVDPLAPEYDRLLKRHRVTPLVRTMPGDAEKLLDRFARDHFDLVYARNCIDHSYDPAEACRQMVAVTRPGSYVYLDHHVDEADRQNFGGLHQWNFRAEDGQFIIAGRDGNENVTTALADSAEVECRIEDSRLIVTMRKKPGGTPHG